MITTELSSKIPRVSLADPAVDAKSNEILGILQQLEALTVSSPDEALSGEFESDDEGLTDYSETFS